MRDIREAPCDTPNMYEMLGVRVYAMTMADMHEMIAEANHTGSRVIITSQNIHGVYMYHRNEVMRRLHARSFPRIDGMPLVLFGQLLGYPIRPEHRVTWVDWIDPLMREATSNGWSIFYLGSREDVVERGADILREKYFGLQLHVRHGHFDATPGGAENEHVIEEINRIRPNILMVGMGMPRQEYWIENNADKLNTSVILTCGAAIEYIAGAIPTPPRWLGKIGLEWLFRLASEPKRLASRYLIEPWFLIPHIARDLWRRSGR